MYSACCVVISAQMGWSVTPLRSKTLHIHVSFCQLRFILEIEGRILRQRVFSSYRVVFEYSMSRPWALIFHISWCSTIGVIYGWSSELWLKPRSASCRCVSIAASWAITAQVAGIGNGGDQLCIYSAGHASIFLAGGMPHKDPQLGRFLEPLGEISLKVDDLEIALFQETDHQYVVCRCLGTSVTENFPGPHIMVVAPERRSEEPSPDRPTGSLSTCFEGTGFREDLRISGAR